MSARLNLDRIMKKVQDFAKSEEGQRRMNAVLKDYRAAGIEQTGAGGRIISAKDMADAAQAMIRILTDHAARSGLPTSVMEHFRLLGSTPPRKLRGDARSGGEDYVVYIRFGGDLHRESLLPEEYDGIDNIVALFNNGYSANNYVYGWWDGHAPSGGAVGELRNAGWTDSVYTRSRKERPALNFIQQAVAEFNATYGAEYSVTATASDEYRQVL